MQIAPRQKRTAAYRRKVAAELRRPRATPIVRGISRRIPVAFPGEYRTAEQIRSANRFERQGGTVTAKGKDSSGNSKWHRRVEAMRAA